MTQQRGLRLGEGSAILYGVPKVGYGTYGGCTPFPICLKACANYLGDDLAYDEAMVLSAAAFRLTWDVTSWNGGNVDICFAFDECARSYETGLRALGREFAFLRRSEKTTKDELKSFIREQIDQGFPVVALGIIGPPEACLVTGYRDNGNTLLGWNFFQDNPEFRGKARIDESGFFVTDVWWENRDSVGLMSIGEKSVPPLEFGEIIANAVTVLSGREKGNYAKGILAYDAWEKAISDDAQFPPGAILPLLAERVMCHGDALDCLSDGRGGAWKYFKRLADAGHGAKNELDTLVTCFQGVAKAVHGMYELLGGWQRDEKAMRALGTPEVRTRTCALIEEAKAADERALDVLIKLKG